MDRFKPLRSSPQTKPSKPHTGSSHATSSDPLPDELQQLSDSEVELLDAVVQRAGPSATTFLTVFKAYSEVLTDKGLDPHETVFYTKLLKLGTMKGRNWGDKWERVKSERGKKSQTTKKTTRAPKPAPPPSIQYEDDTTDDFATFSDRTISPSPRTTGVAPLRKEQQLRKTVHFPKAAPPPRKPPSEDLKPTYTSARSSTASFSHRKLAASPVTKPKEEQAREIVARAKERRGAPLNDADAWKNIQMQHDEQNADLFRQDKLIERCWQIWLQGYQWIVSTHQQVSEARDRVVVQQALDKWKQRFLKHQQLYKHISDLSDRRILLTFVRIWREKAIEARQKKWRQDMRNKMKIVRQNADSRLIRECWAMWRHSAQSHAVYQAYLDKLILRAFVTWKNKMVKVEQLSITADEFQSNRRASLVTYWRKWKGMAECRSAERTMVHRIKLRLLDSAMGKWRAQLRLVWKADTFYQANLRAQVLKQWAGRLTRLHKLEQRADRQLAKSDAMLVYAVLRIWKARWNGKELERQRSKRLLVGVWKQWQYKIQAHNNDIVRAEQYAMRSSSSLAVAALNKWKKALLEIQSREQLADAFHMSHLAIVAIHHWRTRLRQKVKMVRVARAASQYFQMRRAWFRWVEMLEAKRRERLLQAFEGRLKKRRFELWLQKTRVKKERESAVQRMHEQITRRILRDCLSKWTERVIALKSRELDIVQQSNMVLMATAFQKFRTRYLKQVEAQNLLESFMYLKQKELLRRAFCRWLTAARFSHHRRVVLHEKEEEIRLQKLEAIWEKWREKTLQPREDEILLQCQRNILCRVFSKWHGKTKAPPAIRHDAIRVKTRFFKRWREAMGQASKVKEAARMDRHFICSKFFAQWVEAYKTKKTLKAVARARHLRLPQATAKKSLPPITTNAFSKRSSFLRAPTTRDEDNESDVASVASAPIPARALSTTSSTYINKSRPPSIISSASRLSFPKPRASREPSPTRAPQAPPIISRTRSDTRTSWDGSPPPSRRGPSSVVSADIPRRSWADLRRGPRPFLSPL